MPAGRCEATTKAGAPCGMAPIGTSTRCFVHDERWKKKVADGRREGGRNRMRLFANPTMEFDRRPAWLRPKNAHQARNALGRVFEFLCLGKVDKPTAETLVKVASALLQADTAANLQSRDARDGDGDLVLDTALPAPATAADLERESAAPILDAETMMGLDSLPAHELDKPTDGGE